MKRPGKMLKHSFKICMKLWGGSYTLENHSKLLMKMMDALKYPWKKLVEWRRIGKLFLNRYIQRVLYRKRKFYIN